MSVAQYQIEFLDNISYTNSASRIVRIPFRVVPDEGVTLTHPLTFTHIKGAYALNQIGTTVEDNYPQVWNLSSLPETPNSVWEQAGVEYNADDGTYVLKAPFGGSASSAEEYIALSGTSYDGNYNLYTGVETPPVSGHVAVPNCKVYQFTNSGQTYYIKCIKLFIKATTTTGGSGESGGSSSTTTYSFHLTEPSTSSNSTVTPYLTWAVTDNSGVVRLVSIFAKLFSSMNDADKAPIYGSRNVFSNGCVSDVSNLVYSGNDTNNIANFTLGSINNRVNSQATLYGGTSQEEDSHVIYFSLTDNGGGETTPVSTVVQLYTTSPTGLSLTITGSSGSNDYTGYYQKHGRFFPSEYVTVNFSAMSDIGMTYSLTGNIKSVVEGGRLRAGMAYKHLLKIAKGDEHPLLENNMDTAVNITLVVTDDAGNEARTTATIQYISKLYRTSHLNLREVGTDYSHKVYYSPQTTLMSEKQVDESDYTRSWNEIWYPETHSAPLNADGTIDEANAFRVSKSSEDSTGVNGPTASELIKYDKLALNERETQFSTDSDGRILQNTSAWSRTKKYPARENSRLVDDKYETYWIIDNSGNPDFQLEFEVFDFSSHITKYPENLCARYSGDSVSVFDASAPGCLYDNPVVDENGIRHWKLRDSTKLNHLFSLKGSCFNKDTNPFTLLDSEVGGELVDNGGTGFTCPSITQCSRICIVPFTDYGSEDESRGSGFKLKAGSRHFKEYYNYEYLNDTGEFWIHMSPSTGGAWSSKSDIKIAYDYYDSVALTDNENGVATFTARPLYPLLATFAHYLYLYNDLSLTGYPHCYFSEYLPANPINCITSFVASQDDFVEYMNKTFYVSYSGDVPVKDAIYDAASANNDSSGKLTSYRIDGDTGILRCTTLTPPRGRLFADYYYHTYYRLTSDGYGDLYFYGTGILVPASSTNAYKDWTYVDLKVVNEGSNTLDNGKLTFLARGYVTKGTVVDTVLDMNRPWDVQEGTTAETVNRTGAKMETSYATLVAEHPATRQAAFGARSSQVCDLRSIEPKQKVYVRVYWCIASNADGTAWVDVSKGKKTYSAELSGTYYIVSDTNS